MGATMSPNGAVRKSLSAQIDRLDSLLDGLAENLQDVITAAVREAVTVAVAEAVTAVLRETAVRREAGDDPAPASADEPVLPVRAGRAASGATASIWARLILLVATCREWIARIGRVLAGRAVDAPSVPRRRLATPPARSSAGRWGGRPLSSVLPVGPSC